MLRNFDGHKYASRKNKRRASGWDTMNLEDSDTEE